MGVLFNKISRDELKPGLHIYSWRGAYVYAHHGIYVGDDRVIHFTSGTRRGFVSSSVPKHRDHPCPDCGYQSNLNGVISSCLECFLSGGDLYVYEYGVRKPFFLLKLRGGTCTLGDSDPPKVVIHRTRFLLESGGGFGNYNLLKNNCEDFAIYCKTSLRVPTDKRVGASGQVVTLLAAAKSLKKGFCTYFKVRLANDVGYRKDVIKVAVENLVAQHVGVVPDSANDNEQHDKPVANTGL